MEPTRYIIVLWWIEKLPFSYTNRTALNSRIVSFSRDSASGKTTTIIAIGEEWWDQEDRPIPTEQKADSEVSRL